MIFTYKKIRKCCIRGLEAITCIAVLCLLTILLLQIVSRMLKFPIPGTMIFANIFLMWIAFPAACLGIEKKMQLGVDAVYNILSIKYRCFMDIIVGLALAIFAAFAMIYGGSIIAVYLIKNSDWIRFMFYLPLIISGCFMTLQGIERIIYGIYGQPFGEEEK